MLKMVHVWMLQQVVLGGHHQKVFLDVEVFHFNALPYRNSILPSLYHGLEREKQRKYEQRMHKVEMGCFTP